MPNAADLAGAGAALARQASSFNQGRIHEAQAVLVRQGFLEEFTPGVWDQATRAAFHAWAWLHRLPAESWTVEVLLREVI